MGPLLGIPYGSGFTRPLWGQAIPQPNDPKYLDYLADDKQFLDALNTALNQNLNSSSDKYKANQAICQAAAANVGNLTPEERAQIIGAARGGGLVSNAGGAMPAEPGGPVVALIERLANNQGYTGPDADTVVTSTPTASGGAKPITRGEILDNENFGNLVNSVFTSAGGKPYLPPSPLIAGGLGLAGSPGSMFNTVGDRGGLWGMDMTKWSESERIQFLNKVAEFGKDGTMLNWQEQAELRQMAMNFQRNNDNEPTAVTANNTFGKPTAISKDNLMENGTFEKQLMKQVPLNVPRDSDEVKALKDAIATADYDALSYEERVALVKAFNAVNSDGKATTAEIEELTQLLRDCQKSSGATPAGSTKLSNGLVVSKKDVATDDNFMSMVNDVLDRSGCAVSGNNAFGTPSFSNNQYTLPMLRGLDTSKLTPEQRMEVLEMIAQAASDREVTQEEARNIQRQVSEMSGYGPYALPLYRV
jgi:hypothetical protein